MECNTHILKILETRSVLNEQPRNSITHRLRLEVLEMRSVWNERSKNSITHHLILQVVDMRSVLNEQSWGYHYIPLETSSGRNEVSLE